MTALRDLVAKLRLDTTEFQKGLRGTATQIKSMGDSLQRAGQSMSIAITAPMAGLVAASKLATDRMVELRNQARLAGMAAQDFQVLALATEEFGIQQDKLSDILKDVNDRIGDFVQTGGGPMKDFFEQIAPRVGVTVDQFRSLNGADALQLYVSTLERAGVSQADMIFYMEALAGDAARLIPVFQNNGAAIAAMTERARSLGLTIDENLIDSAASVRREFSLVSQVIGIQLQQSLVQLAPAFQALLQTMAPAIEGLARALASIGQAFSSLAPETQRMVIAIGGIAAAMGPALIAFGLLAKAVAVAGAAILALSGPIGLVGVFLGVAATAAIAFSTDAGKVKGPVEEARVALALLNETLGTFSTSASPAAQSAALTTAMAYKRQAEAAIEAAEAEVLRRQSMKDAAESQFPGSGAGMFGAMDRAAAQEEIESLRASLDLARNRIRNVATSITTQMGPAAVTGGAAVGDLTTKVDELGESLKRVGSGPAQAAVDDLPDRVDEVTSRAERLRSTFESAFVGLVTGAQSFRSALGQVAQALAEMAAQAAFRSLFGKLFDGIGSGGGFLGSIFGFAKGGVFTGGKVQAFAKGGVVAGATAFAMQGGLGIMGEAGPEAIMPLSRGADGKLGVVSQSGGVVHVMVTMDESGNLRPVIEQVSGQVTAGIITQYDREALPRRLAQINRSPRRIG